MTNFPSKNCQDIEPSKISRQLILHEFGTALALIMTSSEILQNYYPFLSDHQRRASSLSLSIAVTTHNASSLRGAGLGLAVVTRCIEALNGALETKSSENAGTLVLVRLPVPASV